MESNPEIMNKYLLKLGVPDKWRMVDVIGLEGEALAWVPKPVLAVILLFPLSDTYEQYRRDQENVLLTECLQAPKSIFHIKQGFGNVCGIIALIHGIANNTQHIELKEGLLKNYLKDANDLDASAKGALLENSIVQAYKDMVHEGNDNTEGNEVVSNHFVTFICKDGSIFELDGRTALPINHGPSSPETFLEDAAKICRDFIEREPDNMAFNVVALVSAQ